MTSEKLTELLKIAYRWGRDNGSRWGKDNGSNRSEKNFNDLLRTEVISQALRINNVVERSEQLCQFEQDERYDSSTCKHCGGNKWLLSTGLL